MTPTQPVTKALRQPGVSCPARAGGRAAASMTWGTVPGATSRRSSVDGQARYPVAPMSEQPFAKLSIFFPMWNEEEYINRAVDAARDACDDLIRRGEIVDYELIVVDDASTDATPAIADRLAEQDRHVRVVHHPV